MECVFCYEEIMVSCIECHRMICVYCNSVGLRCLWCYIRIAHKNAIQP